MFGGTPFARFLSWVSLQTHGWLDVHEALRTHRYYSPLRELHLFSEFQGEDRAGELLALDQPLGCAELVSPRPIHDGFIRALVMKPAESGDLRAQVAEFFERERERNVEAWLRTCYAKHEREIEDDIMFRGMDYPSFDNGNVGTGFGLMIDREKTRWLWSRAVFAHK